MLSRVVGSACRRPDRRPHADDLRERMREDSSLVGGFGPVRPPRKNSCDASCLPRLDWKDDKVNFHLRNGTPVILTGSCPLVASIERWSAEYLSQNLPAEASGEWPVHYTPSTVRSVTRVYGEGLGVGGIKEMSYGEFAKALTSRTSSSGSAHDDDDKSNLYLQVLLKWARGGGCYSQRSLGPVLDSELDALDWSWLSTACREIAAGSGDPAQQTALEACQMWHSHGGVETPMHYDGSDNFLAQIRGRKRVRLYPPSSGFRLYPYPVGGPKDNYSLVADPEDPQNHDRFPAFAGLPSYTGVLEPGDVL